MTAAGDSVGEIQAFFAWKNKQRVKDREAAQRKAEIKNFPPKRR